MAKAKKAKAKKALAVRHEVMIHVDTASAKPTVEQLAEPLKDGKKLTIPKTWMSDHQIVRLVQNTPKEQRYTRKGKGGKDFTYVTGSYVTRVLNFVFGWNWDFEVVAHGKEGNQVWVQGKLTVRSPDGEQTIVKTQFGRADIKMLKTGGMVDFGNDLKAASTDALKKCASLLGIASDIYGKMEYKEETGDEPIEQHVSLPPQSVQETIIDIGEKYSTPKPGQVIGPDGKPTDVCAKCGVPIPGAVAAFSKSRYGKLLCREHQAEATPLKRK